MTLPIDRDSRAHSTEHQDWQEFVCANRSIEDHNITEAQSEQ